jgi:hypothetical protein
VSDCCLTPTSLIQANECCMFQWDKWTKLIKWQKFTKCYKNSFIDFVVKTFNDWLHQDIVDFSYSNIASDVGYVY